jgi:hypothetical protein
VAGPWNTCLAVDGKAQNGADLELLLGQPWIFRRFSVDFLR